MTSPSDPSLPSDFGSALAGRPGRDPMDPPTVPPHPDDDLDAPLQESPESGFGSAGPLAADVVFAAVPLVFVSWVVADFLRPSGFRAGFVAVFDGAEASPLSDWLFVRFTGLFSTSSSSSTTGDRGRLPFLLATFGAGAFSTAFDAGAFPFAFDAGAFPLALGAGALETGFAAAAFDAGLDAGAFEEGLEAAFFALTILSSTVESGFPREDLRVRPAIFLWQFRER